MSDIHDRVSRSRAVIAHEGWPWLLGAVVAAVVAARLDHWVVSATMAVVTVFLYLLFRDPARVVPPLPAAIYAPVDGRVVAIEEVQGENMQTAWLLIRVRPSRLGAYTVRAPIEGTIEEIAEGSMNGLRRAGLCIRSEEDDEVLLAFPHRAAWRSPKAFVRYGERLGQGERFAYLRLAPLAEIFLRDSSRVKVAVGDFIRAGDTVVGELLGA